MTNVQANINIRYNKKKFKPGQIIVDIDKEAADRLVKGGHASFFNGPVNSVPKDPVMPDIDETPEELKKELDDNWTLEELKEDAQEIGYEFPSNITKGSLISKIIEEGKAHAFLNLLEEE